MSENGHLSKALSDDDLEAAQRLFPWKPEPPVQRRGPDTHEERMATLEEVGAALGVSRERARQIEAGALRKLRRALAESGLTLRDLIP